MAKDDVGVFSNVPIGGKARIGRYEIRRRLAVGGMAELFLARAIGIEGFQKDVVIKRMLPQYTQHKLMVEMFLDEARIAGRLHHPNIAQVFDIGETDGEYFFAMEYIDGQDVGALLRQCHARKEQLPLEHAVGISISIAAALNHAHNLKDDRGQNLDVVHRDVSPSNLMIAYDGTVKLVDFGIAKARERVHQTTVGNIKGKFAYMSPEQHRGEEVDGRSDIFALGIVLYEMSTTKPLFNAVSQIESRERILSGNYPSPSTLRSDFPGELEAIIMRALEFDRTNRYQSAGAMLLDLESFARDSKLPVSTAGLGVAMHTYFATNLRASTYEDHDASADNDLTRVEQLHRGRQAIVDTYSGDFTIPSEQIETSGLQSAAGSKVSRPRSLVGEMVGYRYQVAEKISQDHASTTYLAHHQPHDRPVVLTIMDTLDDAMARDRFLRESRAAAGLNHINIASLYDFGEHQLGPFVAMEYTDDPSLLEIMRESKPMPWRRALGLATQIARGISAADAAGVVHRDIRPANVIVSSSSAGDHLKIRGFEKSSIANQVPGSQRSRGSIGSPEYMSPERVQGMRGDVRSDLYSLGIVLFEMLVGRHPFAGESPAGLLAAHSLVKPPALAVVAPAIPPALGRLVDQLLSKRPSDRPEDGAALVQAFDAAVPHNPTSIGDEAVWLRAPFDGAPEGRVAFVSTQIENAPSLLGPDSRSVRHALDIHNSVIRQALREAGGYELRAPGDDFLLAFDSESKAVKWCLEVQRKLEQQPWLQNPSLGQYDQTHLDDHDRGPSLRVRMGVHGGRPECRRDPITGRMDYGGSVVKGAARIQGLAHGGQILVSAEVEDAMRADLASLGARAERLETPGPEGHEMVWEVVDLLSQHRLFPAHHTRRGANQGGLSIDSSAFIGREQELQVITARFYSGAPLVTVTGPGGSGKTRLSRVIANEMLSTIEGPLEVWFCDLSSANNETELTTIVAGVLSIPLGFGEAVEDAIELVGRSLSRRGRVLLVADNFEQLVHVAEKTVGAWLQRAPELQVLATSREALGLAGEQRIELQPLTTEDGRELFEARVRELGLPPTGQADAIDELIVALDGIPLAIELAAGRVGLMTPRQILSRLNRRFEILRGTRRDVSARQLTLQGAIDWSWDLLSAVERDAFTQLSVFADGVDLNAAEQILDLSGHKGSPLVLDLIQALRDKSLLRTEQTTDGWTRLTMLKSIQEYAVDKLAESEDGGDAISKRHAEYFLDEGKRRAKACTTKHAREAMMWLAGNRQNLLAVAERFRTTNPALAVQAILALAPLLSERDPTDLHRALLDDAINLARAAGDEVVIAETLLHRANLEQERGSAELALAFIEDAQSILGPDRAPVLRAVSLIRQGGTLYRLGRMQEGAAALSAAEPLARAQGAHGLVARILMQRGLLALTQLDAPHDYFAKALTMARRSGDRHMEARVLGNHGVDLMVRGDLLEAEGAMQAALAIHVENGARGHEGLMLGNLGTVALALGQLELAEQYLQRGLDIHREVGNRLLEGADLCNLACVLMQQSRIRESIANAERALPLILESNGLREQSICRCILATGYASIDDVDASLASMASLDASHQTYWKSQACLFTLVSAHQALAQARASGGAPDDARLEQVRTVIEDLRDEKSIVFLSLTTLTQALAAYPSAPSDGSGLALTVLAGGTT